MWNLEQYQCSIHEGRILQVAPFDGFLYKKYIRDIQQIDHIYDLQKCKRGIISFLSNVVYASKCEKCRYLYNTFPSEEKIKLSGVNNDLIININK